MFDLILREATANSLGELLRELSFKGDGYGCYETFDQREGAIAWNDDQKFDFWKKLESYIIRDLAKVTDITTEAEETINKDKLTFYTKVGEGFQWHHDGWFVWCCYYWDGDGVLAFIVGKTDEEKSRRCIINEDCKKNYGWYEIPLSDK